METIAPLTGDSRCDGSFSLSGVCWLLFCISTAVVVCGCCTISESFETERLQKKVWIFTATPTGVSDSVSN